MAAQSFTMSYEQVKSEVIRALRNAGSKGITSMRLFDEVTGRRKMSVATEGGIAVKIDDAIRELSDKGMVVIDTEYDTYRYKIKR